MLITDKELLKKYESRNNLWLGIPSIEVTKKGRTFITFYSGGITEEIGNYVLLLKSDDGKNFGEPFAACYLEDHRCFDPCLWIDPIGRLWLTWSLCPDDAVYAAICEDPDADEIVFGEEFIIGHNVMMNKPVVLSSGEWLFPIAVWNYGVRVLDESFDSPVEPKGSFAYMTTDCGKTFTQLGTADVKGRDYDEHMILELKNGDLRLYARTDYGIGAADSKDKGLTWGESFDTTYRGPGSRFHVRRLKSGRMLLINHFEYTGRNNLTAMLSEDDGKTFPYKLLLDERDKVSYPDATVTEDGTIYITYDRERGCGCYSFEEAIGSAREILVAKITEEDIINGSLVKEDSYLKRVVYKLTEYVGDLHTRQF